jgi:chromosome segregation ATPase
MSEANFLQKISRRKDNGPPPQPAPRLSHKAAQVAQQMESLEDELSTALERAQAAENRALVAEQRLAEAQIRISKLQDERDVARDEISRLDGSFDTIASALLKIMESRRKQGVEFYRPGTEGKRAVNRAMAKEEERAPIPDFLTKPAETEEPQR